MPNKPCNTFTVGCYPRDRQVISLRTVYVYEKRQRGTLSSLSIFLSSVFIAGPIAGYTAASPQHMVEMAIRPWPS